MPLKVESTLRQGGGFNINANLKLIPEIKLTATVGTHDLPLNIGQPYVKQFAHIQLNDGRLNSDIKVDYAIGGNMTAGGSVHIPQLDVSNTLDNDKLLSWESLEIDQFDYNLSDKELRFSQLSFDQLYGTFVIDEEKKTNVSGLLVKADEPA